MNLTSFFNLKNVSFSIEELEAPYEDNQTSTNSKNVKGQPMYQAYYESNKPIEFDIGTSKNNITVTDDDSAVLYATYNVSDKLVKITKNDTVIWEQLTLF